MSGTFDEVLKRAFFAGLGVGADRDYPQTEKELAYCEAEYSKWRREFGGLSGLEDEAPVSVGAASSVGSEQTEDEGRSFPHARSASDICACSEYKNTHYTSAHNSAFSEDLDFIFE